jgi:hypothetical protein
VSTSWERWESPGGAGDLRSRGPDTEQRRAMHRCSFSSTTSSTLAAFRGGCEMDRSDGLCGER